MFLRYLEFFVIAVVILVFATQVFIPMWKGTKTWPLFRSRQRQLESKLTELREEAHTAELERAVGEERGRVIELHNKDRRNADA